MQEDIVLKFMLLYQILLTEAKDCQKKVDPIIVGISQHLSKEKTIEIQHGYQENQKFTRKTDKQNTNQGLEPVWESVYTKLRNQLSHIRPDIRPEEDKTPGVASLKDGSVPENHVIPSKKSSEHLTHQQRPKPIEAEVTYKHISAHVENLEVLVREMIILKYKQSDGQDLLEAIKRNGEDKIKKLRT
jgi:hypothetical protein